MEVTELTDEDLKQQLAKHGVDSGPIVGKVPVASLEDRSCIIAMAKVNVVVLEKLF